MLSTVKSCLKILKKRKVDVTKDFSKFETKNLKYKVLRQPLKLGLGITPFGGSDKSGNFYKEGLICASNQMSYLKVNYFS